VCVLCIFFPVCCLFVLFFVFGGESGFVCDCLLFFFLFSIFSFFFFFLVRPTGVRRRFADFAACHEEILWDDPRVHAVFDYDEAVSIATGFDYGLTRGSVHQRSREAHKFARDVDAGYVWIKRLLREHARLPASVESKTVPWAGRGREDTVELYAIQRMVTVNFGGS